MSHRTALPISAEALSGLLLVIAAGFAIALSNSPWAAVYDAAFGLHFAISLGGHGLDKPLLLWINDGLMAVFFVLVGLEIKREFLFGRLSSRDRAILPLLAAAGGMAAPAAIFVALNGGDAEALRGWAIPTATDIAFAVGVLALLGPRVPPGLKIFLLALAVLDDLGAIVIIAAFYTSDLSTAALAAAGGVGVLLFALNRLRITRLTPYLLLGLVLWVAVLKSGVHATLAGVVVAFAIPGRGATATALSPLSRLEHMLHGWVSFGIMPLFAFANAGVSLAGLSWSHFASPVTAGIGLGLFFGKQGGVMAATWLAVRAGLARLPDGVSWREMYGVALLAGIGFTMSLFIGMLAFADPEHASALRLGVLSGSLASACCGYVWLRLSRRAPAAGETAAS